MLFKLAAAVLNFTLKHLNFKNLNFLRESERRGVDPWALGAIFATLEHTIDTVYIDDSLELGAAKDCP